MYSSQRVKWDPKHQTNITRMETVWSQNQSFTAAAFLTSPTGPSAHTASHDANPPKPAAATGLLPGLFEGQGEDTDDDDAANEAGADLKLNNQPNSREYAERYS